jgi:hypothetical protein
MSNTYAFINTSKEYIPYEKTVKEIRAPTDDSIRLYEEFKEKAYLSVLDTLEVNDNTFNIKAILYKDLYSYRNIIKYKYTLNSKDFLGEYSTSLEKLSVSKHVVLSEIYKKLSEQIAKEILIKFSPNELD